MRTLTFLVGIPVLLVGALALFLFLYLRQEDNGPKAGAGDPPGGWEKIDERTLAPDFIKLAFRPFDDPSLAFTMWVPKGWEARPVDTSQLQRSLDHDQEVVIADVAPSDSEDVVVQVSYVIPPRELSLKKAMDETAKGMTSQFLEGLSPKGMDDSRTTLYQEIKMLNGVQTAEQLIEVKNRQTGFLSEFFHGFRKGERLTMIKGMCPSLKYAKWSRAFQVAGRTFAFTAP